MGFLCLVAWSSLFQLKSQTMVVVKTDGSEQSIELSLLQNFVCPSRQLVFNYHDKTSASMPLSEVTKMVFKTSTSSAAAPSKSGTYLYVNLTI